MVERHAVAFVVVVAVIAGSCYLLVALHTFNGRPILLDEIAQVRQAEIFARGHLWLPRPAHPEFFSSDLMVDLGGRLYSQFPPGGPAMLTFGVLAGAPWAVDPACAIVAVILFAWLLRVVEPDRRVAAAATALFALAPFTVFMSGSHMNHVTALMWILLGAGALFHGMASPTPRPMLAFVGGLGFGIAATIRPVDALAFAAPAAAWYVWRALRDSARWHDAVAALAGVALPIAGMMWVNAQTTGAALRFGYEALWGPGHDLGFHQAPWGLTHTPARGVELVNLNFLRLQFYLFETLLPSLVPAMAALALARPLRAPDRYLIASGALLVALYFAYWHDGFYLGPRFMYGLAPALALWTARCPGFVADRLRSVRWGERARIVVFRTTVFTLATSTIGALAYTIPLRASSYRLHFVTERWATPGVAAEAGVHKALVFVREGWDEQLVARMWALGVPRAAAEALRRNVDICRLDSAVLALESLGDAGAPDPSPFDRLRPMLADSLSVGVARISQSVTLHAGRGVNYSAQCLARVQETAAGVSALAPMLAMSGARSGDDNIYARDLGRRDTLLLAEYPSRPVYVLRPTSSLPTALPAFYPVSRDSLEYAWADERHGE